MSPMPALGAVHRAEKVLASINTPCCQLDGGGGGEDAGAPPLPLPPPQAASVAAASNIIVRITTVTDIIDVRIWPEFDFDSITMVAVKFCPDS